MHWPGKEGGSETRREPIPGGSVAAIQAANGLITPFLPRPSSICCNSGKKPWGFGLIALLECLDRFGVLQSQTDVIKAVEQHMLA